MTSRYITVQSLRSYLGANNTSEDALLNGMIEAAERYLDDRCNTQFVESTGVRYYREDDLRPLPDMGGRTRNLTANSLFYATYTNNNTIGRNWERLERSVLMLGKDCLSVQTLLNGDGTTITSTEYWLEPRNDPPYQYIRLKTAKAWTFGTDGEITVTGCWGASTAPSYAVQHVVTRIAGFWYKQRDSQVFDTIAIPELGQLTIPKGIAADVDRIINDAGLIREFPFV